ncbi:MAG: HNH endonuclease [Barrevirus sp.]|uniref:HNH endonuclease n=1 Tax=Barrevirus sp. TaxID=2487763 RepID=A0A3G4ZU93_9VIRU|nr:MAG: HNH endonuclease [Barrevirus sp.]
MSKIILFEDFTNGIISLKEYIDGVIAKPVITDVKLLELMDLCIKNGYELVNKEYDYENLFVFCKVHGIFVTDSYKLRGHKRCGKCYREHIVNVDRNNNNPDLIGMEQIPGFDNYFVSKDARVYSTISETFIEINIEKYKTNNRRVRIKIYNNDNERKSMELSRLVALTYLENPENKPEVNHKDGDWYNNNLSNLEWNTKKENTDHAIENGLIKPCDQGKRVDKYDLNNNFIKSYNSFKEAIEENKISEDSIRDYLEII